MAINEPGHHINVDNLDPLMERIKKVGVLYRPVKKSLLLANVQILYTQGKVHLKTVDTQLAIWKLAVDNRQEVFRKTNPLVTRIIGNLYSMDVKSSLIEDAKELQRK